MVSTITTFSTAYAGNFRFQPSIYKQFWRSTKKFTTEICYKYLKVTLSSHNVATLRRKTHENTFSSVTALLLTAG